MKKLITIGVVVTTLVTTLGVSAIVAVPVHAASAGQLIKMAGNNSVYYLGADNKRYMFPTETTYKSWFKDFSSVVTISSTELQSYDLGGNVTMRPGTNLVKITTVPKTYAVEPNGTLRWITSESVASSLYGSQWYKKVVDVPDGFWVNYDHTSGVDLSTASYPTGSLVKESGSATIYYIDGATKRPIADMTAFDANRFNLSFVQTASDLSSYSAGTSITGAESALTTVSGTTGGGTPSTSTGTLTVSLASDTPAADTVVQNATYVKFTKVNFTATGGDVVIDSMTIKRSGNLAQDSNFSNIYLLDSTDTMVGNEKTLGSTHTVTINDDITISNGTTKSYWIAATMNSTLQSGEIAGLALSEVVVKGNATVSGTLPITGNSMTMNSTITMGTVTQAAGSTNPTTGSTSKQVGTTDYVFAAAKLTVNSTEDVQVERIRFYQSGTSADADIANLDLVVDGVVLATVAKPTNKAVIYDLSASPYTILKGNNKTFEIRGDIVDGSSRTVEFEFDKKTDIKAKGKNYGFYITPTYVSTTSPYWNNTSYATISTGTLTVSKKILSSTYIAEGSTQTVVGAFNFRAQGEPIIISSIKFDVETSTSAGAITNVTIYDEGGNVVAGPVDPSTGSDPDTVTLTDTWTVPTGEHVYTVKADLDSNWSSGDTIYMQIDTPDADITAKGETTNNSVTASPTSAVAADTMTVRVGSLNISTLNSPVAQSVVAGTSGFTFAQFVLDASASGEDVKVTQLKVRHSTTAANLHQDISGIKIYDGADVLNLNDVEAGDATTVSAATSTIDFDSALIIPKGTSKTLVLKGDIGGSATGGQMFGLVGSDCAVVYGNSTGNSIDETITNGEGQLMTVVSNASLTIGVSSASATNDGLLPGNTEGLTVGVFNFRAQYSDVNLEEVYLTVSTTTSQSAAGGPDQFNKIYLYDGTKKVAEATATTTDSLVETQGATDTNNNNTIHFDMSANPVKVTAGTTIDLTVKVDTSNPDYYNYLANTKGESGEGFRLAINAKGDVVARAASLLGASNKTLNSATLKDYYLFKSVPTVLTNDLISGGISSGTLLAGTESGKSLYKFSVTADNAGDIGLGQVSFLVTTSTATATSFVLYEGGRQVAATTTYQNVSAGKFIVAFLFTSDYTAPDAGEGDIQPFTIAKGQTSTFTFKADVEGPSGTTTGSVQVQFLGDGSALGTFPAGYGVGGTNNITAKSYEGNFVWGDYWRTYDSSSTTCEETEQWSNGYLVPTGATTKLQSTSTSVTFSK